jgi:16S rRNA (guanine527-N7)-methyltransferase
MSSLSEQFDHLADGLDFDISLEQKQKLIGFVELMAKWNKAYNLTSVRNIDEMMVKHIFDSIVVAPFLTKETYADVGTGPGLPGVPLAIMHPEKQFVLIDSLGKRIRFIKQALHELGIKNVEAIQARVETVTDKKVNAVLSRAFASIKDMLEWCEHLVEEDGQFLALKGQIHQLELDEIPSSFKVLNTEKLNVPSLDGERHLVTLVKNI